MVQAKEVVIGKPPGTAKVEVGWHGMQVQEQSDSANITTRISGIILNTGDLTLNPKDIEVVIKYEVTGKSGSSEVYAQLDPSPEEIRPGDAHNFTAIVLREIKPVYSITARVINQ